MKCPYCGYQEDKVIDSRQFKDGSSIRRRRECLKCGKRFTTYERIEDIPMMVIKKDGRREPFQRQKLLTGLIKACEKRPVSMEKLDEVVSEIETKIQEMNVREISSSWIGEKVIERLKEIDKVAYVRFASVYREFKDVGQFMNEVKVLLRES
ncbi:MAG: transcriptional regulator NrdR [Candidatus Aminicenantia bacterium]